MGEAKLFWTGGWDSTFRLLQLLLEEKQVVQTYYVVRAEQSTGQEIDAMNKIRRYLYRNYDFTRDLLKTIKYVNMNEIVEVPEIRERYNELKKDKKVNIQYVLLAELCHQLGIEDVELGIEGAQTPNHADFFDKNCPIFKNFSYKITHLDKKKMEKIARQKGWLEVMKLTVFCRRPKRGRPCGLCGPCADAVKEGLGWRLPLRSRVIAYLQIPFRRYWREKYGDRDNSLLKFVPKILKGRY